MSTERSTRTVEDIVEDWPRYSRKTARGLLEKYGPPDEATTSRLVWYDTGPWKRTILHRSGPLHEFPVPHRDYLEQHIDYGVPPGKFDDLARYDGSVLASRTRGELGATCHEEGANVLAVNLAHEIVTDQKTVEEAREAYAKIMAKGKAAGSPDYMESFQFEVPEGGQGDRDVTIVTDELKRNARMIPLLGLLLAGVVYYLKGRNSTS